MVPDQKASLPRSIRKWLPPHALADGWPFVFGRRTRFALPERIRRDIERQQEAGEIIVGWTQVTAVVFFAVVYAISPKAFPPGTPFEPVPWTPGNLRAVYRGPPCTRLPGSIEPRLCCHFGGCRDSRSDDHDLEFSPSVSGTARAVPESADTDVRLHPYRVADATVRARLCAARRRVRGLGRLTLFLYAVWGSDGAVLTHSYVEYVTSYKILGGAEIDKILSIFVVTAILALSLVRARDLLAQSVAEEQVASDLSRFFAPEVVAQIRRADGEVESMRCNGRHAAILMNDLLHRPFAMSFGARADGSARGVSNAAGAGDPAAQWPHRQISR